MISTIQKRDGRQVDFDLSKITDAIHKALVASGSSRDIAVAEDLAKQVQVKLEELPAGRVPTVEGVQDTVEYVLAENGYIRTSKAYILYRDERSRAREVNSRLIKTINDITFSDAKFSDVKRENANIDADTAMGTMLKYGSETAKQFYEMCVLKDAHAKAHADGDIHIHDLDFYTLTTTCTQIDILKLFKGGFSTGHGVLREPTDIASYSALCCIAIQSNQNDQHGGQSIANFDYGMAEGVAKTYRRNYRKNLGAALELLAGMTEPKDFVTKICDVAEEESGSKPQIETDEAYKTAEYAELVKTGLNPELVNRCQDYAVKAAYRDTDRATFQAMEAFIHNLNTMHSRAGAQTPFSSINYGMDTSPEGRMVIRNLLLSTADGLGNGETPIFPIQIFRVKKGVSYEPGDPNYDLFHLACEVSAKRLFPNFSFMDAPFNAQYYNGSYETEVGYMGCRTRVIGNVYDPSREITTGRGNLSFTSINLPRLAIKAKGDIDLFFELLDNMLRLVADQLDERLEIQSRKRVYNMPFLMGQGVWIDSEKLDWDDEVREVLKHGTLSIGFIGLAETLKALIGVHHGESEKAQHLGLEIVGHIRAFCDNRSKETGLNYTCLATPAEGLSGRFVRMDRAKYGAIEGITDRDYYTNSFHVPVYYPCSAFHKIEIEGPYHALTNAGHISYVELDGDTVQNVEAFEQIIRCMAENGMGYGSINHPVDRDPVCGYNGIIGDICPGCGRTEDDVPFERIRRITGYLVGTLDRFNNGKRAEERDRVKHGLNELNL